MNPNDGLEELDLGDMIGLVIGGLALAGVLALKVAGVSGSKLWWGLAAVPIAYVGVKAYTATKTSSVSSAAKTPYLTPDQRRSLCFEG